MSAVATAATVKHADVHGWMTWEFDIRYQAGQGAVKCRLVRHRTPHRQGGVGWSDWATAVSLFGPNHREVLL